LDIIIPSHRPFVLLERDFLLGSQRVNVRSTMAVCPSDPWPVSHPHAYLDYFFLDYVFLQLDKQRLRQVKELLKQRKSEWNVPEDRLAKFVGEYSLIRGEFGLTTNDNSDDSVRSVVSRSSAGDGRSLVRKGGLEAETIVAEFASVGNPFGAVKQQSSLTMQ
jgi:hypothetical protein